MKFNCAALIVLLSAVPSSLAKVSSSSLRGGSGRDLSISKEVLKQQLALIEAELAELEEEDLMEQEEEVLDEEEEVSEEEPDLEKLKNLEPEPYPPKGATYYAYDPKTHKGTVEYGDESEKMETEEEKMLLFNFMKSRGRKDDEDDKKEKGRKDKKDDEEEEKEEKEKNKLKDKLKDAKEKLEELAEGGIPWEDKFNSTAFDEKFDELKDIVEAKIDESEKLEAENEENMLMSDVFEEEEEEKMYRGRKDDEDDEEEEKEEKEKNKLKDAKEKLEELAEGDLPWEDKFNSTAFDEKFDELKEDAKEKLEELAEELAEGDLPWEDKFNSTAFDEKFDELKDIVVAIKLMGRIGSRE